MSKIECGDLVEVNSVLPGDFHRAPFCGTVKALGTDDDGEYATIQNREGDYFDIDTGRLQVVG